jgi:hypothetical protein
MTFNCNNYGGKSIKLVDGAMVLKKNLLYLLKHSLIFPTWRSCYWWQKLKIGMWLATKDLWPLKLNAWFLHGNSMWRIGYSHGGWEFKFIVAIGACTFEGARWKFKCIICYNSFDVGGLLNNWYWYLFCMCLLMLWWNIM